MADTRVNTHQVPPVGPEEDQVPPGGLEPIFGVFVKQQQSHVTYIIPISGQLFGKIKKEKKCFGGRFDLMTGCRGYRERERKG